MSVFDARPPDGRIHTVADPLRRSSLRLLGVAAAVVIAGCGSASRALPKAPAQPPPTYSIQSHPSPVAHAAPGGPAHIAVIVMENEEYGSVLGSRSAPFINSVADRYALATGMYAVTHPSLPNYLALTGGSTFGISSDCTGCRVGATSLVDQLQAAHLSWRGYMEDLPHACFTGSSAGEYAKKHDPFAYYTRIVSKPEQCANIVPLTRLSPDERRGTLPRFLWITPNLCHDMHDCPLPAPARGSPCPPTTTPSCRRSRTCSGWVGCVAPRAPAPPRSRRCSPGAEAMRRLIVNADDFGLTEGVTQGILAAHVGGIVTSTSLMVDAPGAEHAAALAREHPRLSVGLHFVDDGPDLDQPGHAEREFARQLERFRALTGSEPTHVDSHHHVHIARMPTFAALVEPLGVPLRGDGRVRYLGAFFAHPQRGVVDHDRIRPPFLLALLEREATSAFSELGCHPGRVTEDLHSSYGPEREIEVATLTEAGLPERIEALGLTLVSYQDCGAG